ncbi:type I polyketide synthase [Planosporangium flavigriseum]|uniref:type I polyketide synthase n=1 Tax=Planosporangium flavigriseum TaxID=373681 RepID=UPI001EF250C3|nr:type I polyketide synthase [Planosporangium flavigriseum]
MIDLVDGDQLALEILERVVAETTGSIGVRLGPGCAASLDDIRRRAGGRVDLVVTGPDGPWPVARLAAHYRVVAEVTSLIEANEAIAAGAAGLIARGMESGGRVGDLSSFVLLQQLVADDAVTVPIWVAGGIGARTAAACVVGGAAGVVLDTQLTLMPESDLPDHVIAAIRRMDGTEAVLDGQVRGIRLGRQHGEVDQVLPVGQDGWLAAVFAQRWPDTAAAVRGIRKVITGAIADSTAGALFAPGAPLAVSLGTRLPVAQGPMTRVSDEGGFAAAVAAEGGLPFIALGVADAEQSRRMLRRAAETLSEHRWGVGVLGFVPEELRAAQIAAILETRPSYAIIAGGRPAQAKALEAEGIGAFLHVPSPGLLRQFLGAGARRFVFEGAECGGHIGPRASFPLWEAQLAVIEEFLVEAPAEAPDRLEVFFAGGIHDARSVAMVAAMAAPLAARGVRFGVLMGTAYLFTAEAVEHGAIQPLFQRLAISASRTALLQTAPGHVTRCLQSPFVDDFHDLRSRLEHAGVQHREIWERLELLNVGRLRIASKGRRRDADTLVSVDEAAQEAEGLFMAGQVAVLRDRTTTVAALHAEVTSGAEAFHAARIAELRAADGTNVAAVGEQPKPMDIAIIGMACVLPGAPDLASYWRSILAASDAITEVPADRWDVDTYYAPEVGPGQAGRISVSKWGGFLDPVPFDAIRYGIPPSALASIDPAQLLALEVSHRALVDAGYRYDDPGADHERTGVVFGAEAGSDMGYAQTLRTLLPAYLGEIPQALAEQLPVVTEDSFPGILANVIAGRVANRLDLGGPNFTVDAACASSLAALDAACRELEAGGSDLMLCGGADLHNGINDYLMFTSAHALSPTGRCRTFDSTGDGIALGEGVACVVLKRLADAERDGDRIYAVVKGVGAASDGRALGLTAPRAEGQRRALERAYRRAGISPREVGLIEAHGTGTVVGDRTELQTLTNMFREAGAEPGSCALGSVKSQIGHTKCAAGLAGVIKVAMAVYTGVKPPTINLSRPNPAWSPEHSPFAFHAAASPWAAPASERIAGVSAFGFGGTNYHAVLCAHPATPTPRHSAPAWPVELFCFRGTDSAAAHRAVRKLAEELETAARTFEPVRLRDLAAATAAQSDPRLGPIRVAVVARDLAELRTLLDRALEGVHDPARGLVQPPDGATDTAGKVAFVFPGQGSQRVGALAELFVAFPELRRFLDLGRRWAGLLFPATAFDPETERRQQDRLRDTRVAQPVLGIGGLGVHHLLRRLGVRPDMAGGHSYGELVALSVAGAFDSATLLELSAERADAILASVGDDPGTMAAVTGTADQVRGVLRDSGLADDVVVANHNAPNQVVISGPTQAVDSASAGLRSAGLAARPLSVACAFHSPMVAGGTDRFARTLAGVPVSPPRIPVWSNRTASPYPDEPDRIRAELAEQITSPVRFCDQIEAMYADGARVFVEVGPGRVLTGLVGAVLGDRPHLAVSCDGRPGDGLRALLIAVAQLACAGVPVQTGWLFRGRGTTDAGATAAADRPIWMVNGQLVRDLNGDTLAGGMTPPRRVEELLMTMVNRSPDTARDSRDELLAEFLRASREMIASQRDVLLAYLGGGPGGRLVWESTGGPAPVPALIPSQSFGQQPGGSAPALVGAPAVASTAAVRPEVVQAARIEPEPPATAAATPVLPDFKGAVLAVISERTGYPVDMIDLDLDLEADLSIDSIKRAEVAGEVATRLRLSADGDPEELADLVKARTVRAMVQWLDERVTAAAGSPPALEPAEPMHPAPAEAAPQPSGARPAGVAPRRLVAVESPVEEVERQPASTLAGARFLVTGSTPVVPHLAALLAEHGAAVLTGVVDGATGDPAGGVDGLIMLDGLAHGPVPMLPRAFPFIQRVLAADPRWLLAAATEPASPRVDGLPGLFRTISQEYRQTMARFVGVNRELPPEQQARQLLDELLSPGSAAVVSHRPEGRFVADLVPSGLGTLASGGAGPAGEGVAEAQAIGLDQDSVVVLIGGARGITTWFARALATASKCRIELIGRTPLPEDAEDAGDADLAAALDATALRAALARRGMRSPADIERAAQTVLARREVAATLAELTELGSSVRYHTLDARDSVATRQLLEKLHEEHQRIDGLVYAAGVIEDKLLADKDPESFARVFDTKVNGARVVLDVLAERAAAPSFVVLFGSIAAAYGSRGQGDYAAANDALDSMGARWSAATGHRCLTVHWGPWAPAAGHGGMVTPELSAEFARRGIELIDPEEGAMSLLRELAWGDASVTSVCYTA